MSSVVDRLFPLSQCAEQDPLGGYPDGSEHRQATAYFLSIAEADRKIIHWYAGDQGLAPHAMAENYVFNLVANYANIDPRRSFTSGIEATLTELARVERYVALFRNSPTRFFPVAQECLTPLLNDAGDYEGTTTQLEWVNLESAPEQFDTLRGYASSQLEIIEGARLFILDPKVSKMFDQAYMLDQLFSAPAPEMCEL